MLRNRETLSARLLGRSALTMATGMPTNQERITDTIAISAVGGPELGEAFRAENGDQRVTGQNTQHDEDDDRDADHRQGPERQAANDVAVHPGNRRQLTRATASSERGVSCRQGSRGLSRRVL